MPRFLIALMAVAMVAWQAAYAQPANRHALPFIPSADSVQQGFVRIINQSGGGTVRIYATDDTGERFGPIELDVGSNQTRHFNSMDLEHGNSEKGLSGGVGDGQGHWWLDLRTNLDIKPLAYIRTPDGFVTSMHDVVREDEDSYHVPFFNPASNQNQRSVLRLTNPGPSMVDFTITGRDDRGRPETREVRVSLGAGASHMLDSNRLEADFGYGTGKWHLTIFTDEPLWVMNLLQTPTGHLTNLSTEPPVLTIPDTHTADPPPKPDHFFAVDGVFGSNNIILNWYYDFGYNDHALTHVYRNNRNDFATAVKIGTSSTSSYVDRGLPVDSRWWYWIRWENRSGLLGPPSDAESATVF